MIQANLLVIALLLITGGGYLALDRSVGHERDGTAFHGLPATEPQEFFRESEILRGVANDNTSSEVTPSNFAESSPDEFLRESALLRGAAKDATFKVTYLHSSSAMSSDEPSTTSETIYQLGGTRRRVDYRSGNGGTVQTFEAGGSGFICGLDHSQTSIVGDDFRAIALASDFGGSGSINSGDHPAFESPPKGTPTPTPRTGADSGLTRYDKKLLGEIATCLRATDGDLERESCFSIDGVTLYDHVSFNGFTTTKEATEFLRSVSEADFDLPYPVVVPTPKPISPLG